MPRAKARWQRFVKAASKDLARDIYRAAVKRGLDVSFASPSTTGSTSASCTSASCASASSGSSPWTDGAKADGSVRDVYSCFGGLLRQMELSDESAGLVAMMTYGLMKAKDLELLPATWRQLLQAALRMAVFQLAGEGEARRAAEKLRTMVETWLPMWQRDYDAFRKRGSVRDLVAAALAAFQEFQKKPTYKDGEIDDFDPRMDVVEDPGKAAAEDSSDGEVFSI